jgi:hypothetical protein
MTDISLPLPSDDKSADTIPPVRKRPHICYQETKIDELEVRLNGIQTALNNQTRKLAVIVGAIAALAPYLGPFLEKLAAQVGPVLDFLGMLPR